MHCQWVEERRENWAWGGFLHSRVTIVQHVIKWVFPTVNLLKSYWKWWVGFFLPSLEIPISPMWASRTWKEAWTLHVSLCLEDLSSEYLKGQARGMDGLKSENIAAVVPNLVAVTLFHHPGNVLKVEVTFWNPNDLFVFVSARRTWKEQQEGKSPSLFLPSFLPLIFFAVEDSWRFDCQRASAINPSIPFFASARILFMFDGKSVMLRTILSDPHAPMA